MTNFLTYALKPHRRQNIHQMLALGSEHLHGHLRQWRRELAQHDLLWKGMRTWPTADTHLSVKKTVRL